MLLARPQVPARSHGEQGAAAAGPSVAADAPGGRDTGGAFRGFSWEGDGGRRGQKRFYMCPHMFSGRGVLTVCGEKNLHRSPLFVLDEGVGALTQVVWGSSGFAN